ncbi:heparinase II/III domain-containing protein [Flavitalea antarctica]
MGIFLTKQEKKKILSGGDRHTTVFLKALERRVMKRVRSGTLVQDEDTSDWYYPASEYLSDAAMLYALRPSKKLASWIKKVALEIALKQEYDWVGPAFRDHSEPLTGHLETAHLCWGISAVLDLAEEIFSTEEVTVIKSALKDKGILLCRRWLQKNSHLANWRGILASGALVAGSVLEDHSVVDEMLNEVTILSEAFQPDGSYGESLQYGNYLGNALMMAYEALIRKYPARAAKLNIAAYAKGMTWMAQSMMYRKPMGGYWGKEPRARAVNFNDSAAIFRPSGDFLLHVAARYKDDKIAAGLASWMFHEYYSSCPNQGPHDLASFGMRNDWGFLTLPLLLRSVKPISPVKAQLSLTTTFSNGNTFVRDSWTGQSILAIQAGNNNGCFAPGHLQGDLNSFMLAYKNERLLIDAGHSCYRNIIHGLESATQTHNTCTFLLQQDKLGLQEDLAKIKLLEQRNVLSRRIISNGQVGKPVDRGGRLLCVKRLSGVSLVVSEVADAYGEPITLFKRHWLQLDRHVTVVIDHVSASQPVKTVWNWMVNNRDFKTQHRIDGNHIIAVRNKTALRLISTGNISVSGPVYAHVHDAYHVKPNQPGEGASGSGLLFRTTAINSGTEIFSTHVIIADDAKDIQQWKFDKTSNGFMMEKDKYTYSVQWLHHEHLNLELQIGNQLTELKQSGEDYSLESKSKV